LNKEELPQKQKSIIVPIYKKEEEEEEEDDDDDDDDDYDDTNCSNYRDLQLNQPHTIFYPRYHIICIRKILQKEWEFNAAVNQLFIHLKKAYASLTRELFNNIII
jgi:hypothetical protein